MRKSAAGSIKGGEELDGKFLGIGLQNALGIAIFTLLVIVSLKIIFTKHEVEGVSEVIRMA